MMALERQKKVSAMPAPHALVVYSREGRKKAFAVCKELRAAGKIVEMDLKQRDWQEAKAYAKEMKIKNVIQVLSKDEVKTIGPDGGVE